MRPLLITIGLLLTTVIHSHAEQPWDTGRTLRDVIGDDLQSQDAGKKLTDYQTNSLCLLLGYFRGFAESAAIAAHYNATSLPYFLPDSLTSEEIERIVYKYLTENPDRLDLKGDALIVAALTRAFPNTVFKPPLTPPKPPSP